MKKKYTLDDALPVIIKAARFYNENLNDKDFLIISKEQSDIKGYEISFKAANFMHFTGVKSSLSPRRFFSSALNGKLSTQNFEFKDVFLAQKKMNVLEQAVSLPYSANMIGQFTYAGFKIQADMATGNSNYVMAFRTDDIVNGNYYPVSVLEEDIRKSTNPTSPIIAIISRPHDIGKYNEVTYKSKKISIDKLHFPKELRALISESAFYQLQSQKKRETEKEKTPMKESAEESFSERIRKNKERSAELERQRKYENSEEVEHKQKKKGSDQPPSSGGDR